MRLLKAIIILLLGFCPAMAREYEVFGPEGGIAFKISLPEGFNPKTDRCPMVILMHGIFSSKDYNPMPALAKGLALAAHYAKHRPAYDMYFIAFSGEDANLRGSEYYAQHPVVPLSQIKYLFNIDMIGDNNPVQYCDVPCIFLENENGDAFQYYHTIFDNWKTAVFTSNEPVFKLVTEFVSRY